MEKKKFIQLYGHNNIKKKLIRFVTTKKKKL